MQSEFFPPAYPGVITPAEFTADLAELARLIADRTRRQETQFAAQEEITHVEALPPYLRPA